MRFKIYSYEVKCKFTMLKIISIIFYDFISFIEQLTNTFAEKNLMILTRDKIINKYIQMHSYL